MKYVKPHLSPELRAQITPVHRRDRKLAVAGVVFLIVSAVLTLNLLPNNDKNQGIKAFSPSPSIELSDSSAPVQEKQVLGISTKQEAPVPQETTTDDFTTYTVKNGDTLFNISQRYSISWNLIAQVNNLSEPYLLKQGQTIKIPQTTTSTIPNKVYTIQPKDTLSSIAKQFNITVSDIIAVNPNLQKSDLITPGQIIKLP